MSNNYSILIVDDDPLCLNSARTLLVSKGYQVQTAATSVEALEKVKSPYGRIGICLVDYRLGEKSGSELAREILNLKQDLYILVHSGDDSREAVHNSWRAGAVGFIEKSASVEHFLEVIRSWCQKYEATYLTVPAFETIGQLSAKASSLQMIGRSRAIQEIADKVLRYRARPENVLIIGETGTGKEKVAQAFKNSPDQPFLVVNCAAYNGSSELMESELFGYVKGAFTGATKDERGLFEEAAHGIVFLDEVHTLSPKAQQKLLRALQEKKVRPVGSSREYATDFRLIAAAKPEIEKNLETGTFLPDFYERLNVLRIDIPPLRERPDDVEPLVAFFCRKYEEETGQKKEFLSRTLEFLHRYSWPRNIRELENTVRRLCIDVDQCKILPEHLDARFFAQSTPGASLGLKEQFDQRLREQVQRGLSAGLSKREVARRVGLPESSLRRTLRKWTETTNPMDLQ